MTKSVTKLVLRLDSRLAMKSGRKKSEKLAGMQEYTYLQWIKNNLYLLGDKVGLSVLLG